VGFYFCVSGLGRWFVGFFRALKLRGGAPGGGGGRRRGAGRAVHARAHAREHARVLRLTAYDN
jgi:hypothetical protein